MCLVLLQYNNLFQLQLSTSFLAYHFMMSSSYKLRCIAPLLLVTEVNVGIHVKQIFLGSLS